MKRTSIVLLWLIILTSIVDPVNHNSAEDEPNNTATDEYLVAGNVVHLVNYDECEDLNVDGFCNGGDMVGLYEGIPTTEEVYALVIFIAFFIGIPSYLLVRKIWKVIKRRINVKRLKDEIDEEFDEEDRSLGRHLPVTEKEFFEFRVKEIKKRKRMEEIEEGNKTDSITVKEEVVLLSSFLFVIYLFWNNGL